MYEIEIKARVENLEKIKRSLEELGFKLVRKEYQKDNYFRSTLRNFEQTGEVLRVREQIPGYNLITYKGPRDKSEMKVREEIEVKIENSPDVIKLLHKLGFEMWVTLEKEREMYQFSKFLVSLDKVRDIGNFLEIEIKMEVLQQEIFGLLDKIGISRNSIEKRTYLELVLEKITEREFDKSRL